MPAALNSDTRVVTSISAGISHPLQNSQIVPYAGFGVTAGRIPINGESKIRAGGNALAGVRFVTLGAVVPYAQLRYTYVVGGDAVSAMAGVTLRF